MSKACIEVLNSIENHLKVLLFSIELRIKIKFQTFKKYRGEVLQSTSIIIY